MRGEDTRSLRLLAGLHPDDYWAIKRALEDTVDELPIPRLDEQEGLWRLARHFAQQAVDGEIAPLAGAAQNSTPTSGRGVRISPQVSGQIGEARSEGFEPPTFGGIRTPPSDP